MVGWSGPVAGFSVMHWRRWISDRWLRIPRSDRAAVLHPPMDKGCPRVFPEVVPVGWSAGSVADIGVPSAERFRTSMSGGHRILAGRCGDPCRTAFWEWQNLDPVRADSGLRRSAWSRMGLGGGCMGFGSVAVMAWDHGASQRTVSGWPKAPVADPVCRRTPPSSIRRLAAPRWRVRWRLPGPATAARWPLSKSQTTRDGSPTSSRRRRRESRPLPLTKRFSA